MATDENPVTAKYDEYQRIAGIIRQAIDQHGADPFYFSDYCAIVGDRCDRVTLFKILLMLAGESERYLELDYRFIDDHGVPYQLSNDQVDRVLSEGPLYHPATGDLVEDFEKKVFLVYRRKHDDS